MVNEVCTTEESQIKNLGGKKQCLEKPVKTFVFAKEDTTFASVAAMKVKSNWDTLIVSKGLVPTPNIEGIEPNNTDPVTKEGRYKDYELKAGVAGTNYRFDLSVCTYEALKSYVDSGYNRIFQITDGEEVTCEVQDDGTVKGRKLSSFFVGFRQEATDDDVPFCNTSIKWEDDVYDIVRATFSASELEGIFDVQLTSVSAAAGSIVFTAKVECTGDNVTTLAQADMQFIQDSDGQQEALTGLSYDANTGQYTATAAAFETGYLEINGVITKVSINYESNQMQVTI